MLFDLGTIQIQKLIVHDVPKHFAGRNDGSAPILSQVESPLNQDVKNFFRERLSGSLGRSAYEVEFNPTTTSQMPAWIKAHLSASLPKFVALSQDMARHLYQSQQGVSPSGLLTVIDLKVENRQGIAILKLERDEGTRLQSQQVSGKTTLKVDHIRDLMLTRKTRVFKVGLFAPVGKTTGPLQGLVCDHQNREGATVASFFLEQFLGCQLREKPELTTQRFYEVAQTFINEDVADPKKKAQYQVALVADLQGTSSTVSPQAFASNNLDVSDRQQFITRVRDAGITGPSFAKDTILIKQHLERIQWSFTKGTIVNVSVDSIGKEVELEKLPDGRTRVQVTDELKEQRGHR